MPGQFDRETLSRRRFLNSAVAGLGAGTTVLLAPRIARPAAGTDSEAFSFGLVTDVHYADAPTRGSRHYRDSLAKLTDAIETFNRRGVSFVVELGDFIDVGPAGPKKEDALAHLRTVDQVYRRFRGERYYVLGNHCVDALSKDEFLENCGASIKASHYAFDAGPFHFVVLDADFRADGTPYAAGNYTWTDTSIPATQQRWLVEDLDKARGKTTFVFVHQNLHDEKDPHGVRNAPEVRRVLESAGNVTAVFQGHMHSGGHAKIAGIHYVTLRATVEGPGLENNAYAVVTVDRSGHLRIEGFAKQPGMRC